MKTILLYSTLDLSHCELEAFLAKLKDTTSIFTPDPLPAALDHTHTIHRILSIRCSIPVVQVRGFATGLLRFDNQYKPVQAFFMTATDKPTQIQHMQGSEGLKL